MKYYEPRAAMRAEHSPRHGAANLRSAAETLPAMAMIPTSELRRLVALMVD